jgi:hypothetical protein
MSDDMTPLDDFEAADLLQTFRGAINAVSVANTVRPASTVRKSAV